MENSMATLKEQLNKVLFTKQFNINMSQRDLEFVDIYINADKKFFVDPAKLLDYNDVKAIIIAFNLVAQKLYIVTNIPSFLHLRMEVYHPKELIL